MNHSTYMAAAPDNATLSFSIVLDLKNEQDFADRLNQIYTRGHSNYRNFMSPLEIATFHEPNATERQAVIATLHENGIHITSSLGNRVLKANATASAINAFFHTTIAEYRAPDNLVFYAAAYDAMVRPDLGIGNLLHLDTVPFERKAYAQPFGSTVGSYPPPNNANYHFFRTLYNIPLEMDGSGQTVAIIGDHFETPHISEYEASEMTGNYVNVSVELHYVDGAYSNVICGDIETDLDVQTLISVVPGIEAILVYACSDSSFDCLVQAAADNRASSMSTSYGPAGTGQGLEDQYNSQMAVLAAQGISFFSASGDTGCTSIATPADLPYTTSVGGVCMTGGWTTSGQVVVTPTYPGEQTWSSHGTGQAGSGGGSSAQFSMPSWQVSAVQQYNTLQAARGATQLSMSYRAYPDVSAYACSAGGVPFNIYSTNPGGYGTCTESGQEQVQGTSIAAPLWSGIMASINQYLATQGLGPVGFLNPLLYDIAANAEDYASAFHDINDPGFDSCGSNTFYSSAGWDATSGVGTPNVSMLMPIVAELIACG